MNRVFRTGSVAMLALLFGFGCPSRPGEPPAAPGDASYRVEGTIVALPSRERPHLLVHHEAIPQFRNESGEIVGMDSMTMPFPVAPGVTLEGFEPGTPVLLTFEVRWRASKDRFRIVSLERLAASRSDPPSTATEGHAPH